MKSFKQQSITSFFCRGDGQSASNDPKRSVSNGGSRDIIASGDTWTELDRKYQASTSFGGTSTGAVASAASIKRMESEISDDESLYEAGSKERAAKVPRSCGIRMDETDSATPDVPLNQSSFDMETDCNNIPDFLGAPINEFLRALSPCCFPLPPLASSPSHTVLVKVTGNFSSIPPPSLEKFVDVWDLNHVRMPCSSKLRRPKSPLYPQQGFTTRWEIIRNAVIREYRMVEDFATAIREYHPDGFSVGRLDGLAYLINKKFTPQQSEYFLKTLLPYIATLVVELPSACPEPMPVLRIGMNHTITLSQHQVAHLLAAMFFCTFHIENNAANDKQDKVQNFPGTCFESLFGMPPETSKMAKRSHCMQEKLKCLLTYFHKVKTERAPGLVSFTRRSLDFFPCWEDSPALLPKLHITHKGKIEDEGAGFLQVDFANKNIGGGVLHRGCVQEEIRFVLNPELIVSRLFTETLQDNECLIITGTERFNSYSGYGETFKWAEPYSDITSRDSWGRRQTQIVAIDATRFDKGDEQFEPVHLRRELNKAFVGFSQNPDECHLTPPVAVATGNWGCGAFRGDKRLKFLIQLLACAEAKRDVVYFTFGDGELQQELFSMYNHLVGMNATVGDIFRTLCLYFEDIVERKRKDRKDKKEMKTVFNYLYDCFAH